MPPDGDPEFDFSALNRGDKPNRYLMCPPVFCATAPDDPAPEFDMPADTLERRWFAMIGRQKRVTQTGANPTLRQYEFVQRTRLFGFPDLVTVRFLPLSDTRSTLAVFSRSRYGHTDFGVNRRRVRAWLEALQGRQP